MRQPQSETVSESALLAAERGCEDAIALQPADFVEQSVEVTEFPPEPAPGRMPPFPDALRHPLQAIAWLVRGAFGIASLILILAVVAAIPILNFLALGYLLEVEGQMAREGRVRSAFPLADLAPRFGSIALGFWLWLLPLRLLASAASDAQLIDAAGAAARNLHVLTIVTAAAVAVHLCLALARGGSLGCFFRPLKNFLWLLRRVRSGQYWETASRNVRGFVGGLRLRHHFSLGLRGFLGAAGWLYVPSALFAAANKTEDPTILLTLIGGVCLTVVLCWMPFLQARFAAENRLRAAFELRAVRRLFGNAPLAWLIAVIVVYALSLPLYLLKVVLLPQDAMWFVTLVFIATIYPAKVVTGWAYHRAARRERQAHFLLRWSARILMVPLVGFYVFLLFFTQFVAEHGKGALFEHHAFLLPVPF